MLNPRDRFTDRVTDYKKYRPGYPVELVSFLEAKCLLTNNSVITDIGSGTGIFSRILLEKGFAVIAVEPNDAMRKQAENDLRQFENFKSINEGAEELPFENESIDLITVAQAFHWFDREKCRHEFRRVLKPEGHAALIWNERLNNTPFLIDFELLLKDFLKEYKFVDHKNVSIDVINDFFSPNKVEIVKYPINQAFGLQDYIGRVLSSSYAPKYGTPEGKVFIEELTGLFNKHNRDGIIEFKYDSTLYLGKL